MKTFLFPLTVFGILLVGAPSGQANLTLRWTPVPAGLRLGFSSQMGTNYQVLIATNLTQWDVASPLIPGDGADQTNLVVVSSQRAACFRLVATPNTANSPSPAGFAALVVGQTLLDYKFTDPSRFEWHGEAGNWVYTKTGPIFGKLVFTYDSDANDGAVYREEIVLTFATATQGAYRYAEFHSGVEVPASVVLGYFDLAAGITAGGAASPASDHPVGGSAP